MKLFCRSSQDIDVFSLKVSIYICLSFVRVTQNNYVYYIGAPLDPMVKERVFAMSNLLNVSMDQVCTLPNTDDNVYSLRKNGNMYMKYSVSNNYYLFLCVKIVYVVK